MDTDVAIIGGAFAGLSAAVTLARSLRSVVVVDSGNPRNAPAAGAHNVLAREGVSPVKLLAAGRREAEHYGAKILNDHATAARRTDDGFEIRLAGGGTVHARRLLLATGLVDELPDVPGVREFWGESVLHCPYCHGWEVRGRHVGVLGTSERSVHQALLFRQLTEEVTFLRHTLSNVDDETAEKFAARDIRVANGVVQRLRADNGVLRAVILDDGDELLIDALAIAPLFIARADLYEQLGGTVTEHPFGAFVSTDEMGRTKIPGVWAAGNVSDLAAMVATSMGAGVTAGAAINADLIAEDVQAAVRARSLLTS